MSKKILFSLLLIGLVSFIALPAFAEEQTAAATEEKAATAAPAEAAPAAAAPAAEAPATPKYKTSTIKAVQEALKAKNEYSGEATGNLDEATAEAIKKFQETNKLKADGIPGPKTREALGIGAAKEEAATTAPAEAAPAAEKAPEKAGSETQSSEKAPEQK